MNGSLFMKRSQAIQSASKNGLSRRRCKSLLLADLQEVASEKSVDEQLEVGNGVNCCPQVGARGQRALQILLITEFSRYHGFNDEVLRAKT